MDLAGYLHRLGVGSPPVPDVATLRRLHAAHVRTIPFENSSVLSKEPIVLRAEPLVEKLVGQRRGGFCYELNTAFATLLNWLGYPVEYLSGRVYGAGDQLGPPFDHMTLRVEAGGETWLVDVGFGHSFSQPLRLQPGVVQDDPVGRFRLDEAADGGMDVLWDRGDGVFRPQYRFDLTPHEVDDFEEMCRFHSTSPDSLFTQGWLCSVATEGGGVTYFRRTLYTYVDRGARETREVADDLEEQELLARWFGIQPSTSRTQTAEPV